MNGFYVSMIFLGILLVLVSLLSIALDKKKVFNFTRSFDEKKQQMTEILNDAEQMIEELNKFSDYIVNQMDLKNEELNKNLKNAEEKVFALGERVKGMCAASYIPVEVNPAADGSSVQSPVSVKQASKHVNRETAAYEPEHLEIEMHQEKAPVDEDETPGYCDSNEELRQADTILEKAAETAAPVATVASAAPVFKKKDKVIPLRNKYSEVLRLSQQGMEALEIAKGLNMGKGEVELIIGLQR